MKKIIVSSIIIITIFINITCNEDIFLSEQDYTIITTKPVELITDSGIVVSSEIIGELSIITRYGVIWDQDKYNINIDNIKKIIYEETPKNAFFETNIDFAILPNKRYYLRTFAYTDNYFVYGNRVTFFSKGVKAPVIDSLSEYSGKSGDTLAIYGKNFINVNAFATVKLHVKDVKINSHTNDEINITIPYMYNGTYGLYVELMDKSTSVTFNITDN